MIREGQKVDIQTGVWTFTGKRGSPTFRERNEWVDLWNDANRDGHEDGVAVGTWNVVRGTGQYAGAAGGGRTAHAGLNRGHGLWYAQQEGFLSLP